MGGMVGMLGTTLMAPAFFCIPGSDTAPGMIGM
jgi:hypothetical protein